MPLYNFEGQWDAKAINTVTKAEFTDTGKDGKDGHKELVTVAPPEEQKGLFESRKLWQVVAEGIRTGNFEVAAKDKARIENEQRQMRAAEKEKGETWQLIHLSAWRTIRFVSTPFSFNAVFIGACADCCDVAYRRITHRDAEGYRGATEGRLLRLSAQRARARVIATGTVPQMSVSFDMTFSRLSSYRPF